MDQEKIGKFIALLRKEQNMTQVELAEKLGITDRAISKWENGRGLPDLSLIKPLCEALDISVNELLSGERLDKKEYQDKVEENILKTIDYTNFKIKKTKNKFKIVLIAILVIILAFPAMFVIDVNRMRNNEPVIFSTWGFSYVPPINLKEDEIYAAIEDYVLEEHKDDNKRYENEKWFASFRVYLLEEKEKDAFYYVYTWVLEESYYEEYGKVKQGSGSSIPHKFTVKNVNGEFKVTEAKIPRDGTYYPIDMKELFPNSVRNDMEDVHYDGTIERLSLDIQKQVELYFHK